ncbi:MAG: hypothetical protein Q7T34_02950 [Candidatus Parcubacteria bacterium]|nr:hypothetical protein [Candidatus Parcubacteria bacterium]
MKKNAFTLIELTIYLAITGTILFLMTGFLWNIIFGSTKETSYQEVRYSSRFAMDKMVGEIRKAQAVNFPLPGASLNSISLSMPDSGLNPTIFEITDGYLTITQGAGAPVKLTADAVFVNNLLFTNLSYPLSPEIVRIEMSVSHLNPENLNEYNAELDLKSSAVLLNSAP